METPTTKQSKPLAIIGLAAKYAQEATDVNRFWKFLLEAREATTSYPKDRLNHEGFYHPDPEHAGTTHTRQAQFLSRNPNAFDAAFFSISKTEAESLDPQQRLVMENVYHALENAGLPMSKFVSSNTSVFAAGFNHDHRDRLSTDPDIALKHQPTGAESSMISGRVSWFYDFKGPSLTVETACSSSMVAFHLATQSLHAGESDMAIVSGANVCSSFHHILSLGYSGFFSADGRCFTFDHRANGYSRGEGVGTVILKDLEKALGDGDTIRAVVLSTALDHDGRTPGLTRPSRDAQVLLIQNAYRSCGLDPRETSFVEAHGAGTLVGDPIEVESLAKAFQSAKRDRPLYVGAVKSNIGHLEGSSGLAGIIKAVLVLEAGVIPPNVNFEKVNPRIKNDEWNICFPLEVTPWPRMEPRRASVNCFGISGTNGHCIMEDAHSYLKRKGLVGRHNTRLTCFPTNGLERNRGEERPPTHLDTISQRERDPTFRLLLLSGFDEGAPRRAAEQLLSYLEAGKEVSDSALLDIAYTLSERRSRFRWNSYILATSCEDLRMQLAMGRGLSQSQYSLKPPRIGFVFTGQGTQDPRMPQQMLRYPVFQNSLAAASAYLQRKGCPSSIIDSIFDPSECSKIDSAETSHISCTVIQVALVDLLASWGLQPDRVVGHSAGEIAAAYCAGKTSREAAWDAAYHRGRLTMQIPGKPKGAMLAVGLDGATLLAHVEEVRRRISGELVIACYNSPKNNTVSGDEQLVLALEQRLGTESVFVRRLRAPNAYHSPRMKDIADAYEAALDSVSGEAGYIRSSKRTVRMFSSSTGEEATKPLLDKTYWVNSLVSTVDFAGALRRMCFEDGHSTVDYLIEIGPHGALQSAIKETLADKGSIAYRMTLNRMDSTTKTLLNTVGHLVAGGANVNLLEVNSHLQSGSRSPELVVDLPPYPFNHFEKSLYESRLTRALRFRECPRHELLGAPIPDSSSLHQSWKHYLRVNENPWLRDHMISGRIVFPGAGYLVMAIEAIRQVWDGTTHAGFRIRDVNLKAILIVPVDNYGIETCFSMCPAEESNLSKSTVWNRFSVSSYNFELDEWTEHCTGFIAGDIVFSINPVTNGRKLVIDREAWDKTQDQASACQTSMDFDRVYDNLESVGLRLGPSFRNLSSVKTAGIKAGVMSGRITIPDIAEAMPKKFARPHLIHPTTLDNALQAGFAAICDLTGTITFKIGHIPSFIQRVWISAIVPHQGSLGCYGQACYFSHDIYTVDTRVWDAQTTNGVLSFSGVRFSPLHSQTAGRIDDQICCSVQWSNDADFLSTASINTREEKQNDYSTESIWFTELQLVAALLASNALSELEEYHFPATVPQHYLRCYAYMKKLARDSAKGLVPGINSDEWQKYSQDHEIRRALLARVAKRDITGKLLLRVGTKLGSILRQDCDPLYIMFGQDDLMTRYYDSVLKTGHIRTRFAQLMSTFYDTYSDMKILEIGAGTGSFTNLVLEFLCPGGDDRGSNNRCISQYDYTDLSSSFFEKAKSRFADREHILRYKVLDISVDPLTQGFARESYDMVIASNVLHATPDILQTLRHARSLLKPGGKMVALEGARQDIAYVNIIFSALAGWWSATEPFREWCPYVPAEKWQKVISQSGFSGVDVEIPSSQYPAFNQLNIMVSTAVVPAVFASDRAVVIVIAEHQDEDLAQALQARLMSTGVAKCAIDRLQSLDGKSLRDIVCISLLDLHCPLLYDMDEANFDRVKHLFTTCDRIQWVTGMEDPRQTMAVGLIRTVRIERASDNLNLVTVAVEFATSSAEDVVNGVARIFSHQYLHDKCTGSYHHNAEYRLHGAQIQTARIVENAEATHSINIQWKDPEIEFTEWNSLQQPVKSQIRRPGALDSLHWVSDTDVSCPLGPTEVEVRVCAVGLNFRDLLVVMGELPEVIIGVEAAGIVTRIGVAVSRQLQVGDRVAYLDDGVTLGALRTLGRAEQDLVVRVPAALRIEEAASMPVIWTTVLYALKTVAQLMPGESILIHAAAGGVGQAAIQYSQMVGAEIFATVSNIEKKTLLVNKYRISADRIFFSRDLAFVTEVRQLAPEGVDVILNSLSGEALHESWGCLAPLGRFIEVGKRDILAGGKLDMGHFSNNKMFTGVDALKLAKDRPKLVGDLLQELMQLWQDGKIHPPEPVTFVPYGQIQSALRSLQTGQNMGKIVCVPQQTDEIPCALDCRAAYSLDPTAAYILAGGMGGIGRSIAHWMVMRGAKHLVFLNRTPQLHAAGQAAVSTLEAKGCRVQVICCDIANAERTKAVLQGIRGPNGASIRGCIICALALADSAFGEMSHRQWQEPLKAKVQGSWNLHQLLSADNLQFFVMLSSVAGVVGNRGQANYNAGNTFQDALARLRVSQGLPGVSIDLGAVDSVGFTAEHRESLRHSFRAVTVHREDQMLAIIDHALDPRLKRTPQTCQLVCGLATRSAYEQRGIPLPPHLQYPLFMNLRDHVSPTGVPTGSTKQHDVQTLLATAQSEEAAVEVALAGIQRKLSSILSIAEDEIDPSRSVRENGVDSLIEMEFRTWISRDLGMTLDKADFNEKSLQELSVEVARLSSLTHYS
ncbi:iterative type I polyketide synthase [Aspergillus indologenus CBS 114.80]|uniref:Iterative type I polyketide synthase n=1 Tax=Aspergillus indologenus CBS 114.80 TaxID=1450541 RepID=A0A2V5IJL0_9EURO|nr:iterative type I polyketide synthase [Aspergillus indologenus CBS 114.80]